jgi:ribosomal protein S6--L-glutamate ligase
MTNGKLGLVADHSKPLPQVVIPRQGAQIGDACLALVRQLQRMGIGLVNDGDAVAIARDKFLTQQALTAAGLPCPDTIFVNAAPGFIRAVERLGGYPVVAKQVSGRQGHDVMRIMNTDDAHELALPALDRRKGLIVQRYFPPEKRRDIRALVIGGKFICAATLIPASDDFRANFHLGSEIESTALSGKLESIAITAAATIGCDVAGVDMMIDADNRPFIVEVNYAPGFKGLESATGLDIAGRIIRFAIDQYDHR